MSQEHDINFCPNCKFDIGLHREMLRHRQEQERLKIYAEVRAELAAHKQGPKQVHELNTHTVPALPAGNKRRKRTDITPELIAKVKELRELRIDHKPLKIKEIAKRIKSLMDIDLQEGTVNYIIYNLIASGKKA